VRRIFGLKTWEVIGDWNKLHEGELREFYCLPNSVRVSKSRKMKQAVMGVMWRRDLMHVVSLQSLKKRAPLENTGVEGRRLLKWILINRMAGLTGSICFAIETSGRLF